MRFETGKKKEQGCNYFPGWKVCLAYAYCFHWFQAGYAYKCYAYKKKATCNCVDKGVFPDYLKLILHQFIKKKTKVIKAITGLTLY